MLIQEALKRHHSKADAGEPETPAAEEVEAPDARVSGETDLENRDPNCVAGSHTGDGGSVRGVEGGGVKAANGKGAAGRRNALAKAVQVAIASFTSCFIKLPLRQCRSPRPYINMDFNIPPKK